MGRQAANLKIAKKKQNQKAKLATNPFDTFANSRRKHEVVNRRVKGEDRDVGRAREKSVAQRRARLNQQIKGTRSSNSFVDKRFGETDANLSLEDKMFLRFQKERSARLRKSSIFNLDDGESKGGGGGIGQEELLTHKGQVLGAGNVQDEDDFSDDDGANGNLDKEVVESLHFGGGLVPSVRNKNEGGIYGPASGPKTRQEMLQEIVMKSKLAKMEKKERKEAQEEGRTQLDLDFEDLVKDQALDFRPVGKDKQLVEMKERAAARTANGGEAPPEKEDAWADYDKHLRVMAFDSKVHATDRTKTSQELAVEAHEKLQKAEDERLRRMHGPTDEQRRAEAQEQVLAEAEAGGSRKRKTDSFGNTILSDAQQTLDAAGPARRITDDDIEGLAAPKKSGAELALANMGRGMSDGGGAEDDEDDNGEGGKENDDDEMREDDWDWEDASDGDDDDELEDDEEEDEEAWGLDEKNDDEQAKGLVTDNIDMSLDEEQGVDEELEEGQEDDEMGADEDEGEQEQEQEQEQEYPEGDDEEGAAPTVNEAMPMTIDCPVNLEEFDELVDKYVKHSLDMTTMIDRIVTWNSVHLPAPRGPANRDRMHNFLSVLLRHYVSVADALGPAAAAARDEHPISRPDISQDGDPEVQDIEGQLQHLEGVIWQLCVDLPQVSPSLFGRTLKVLRNFLEKRLRDYSTGIRNASCWPSVGKLHLLRLVCRVFSATDYKHVVVTPAVLLMCQCLTQCPVATACDVASGLFVSATLLDFSSETQRLVPEVLTFLTSAAALCGPSSTGTGAQLVQKTFDKTGLRWLRNTWTHVAETSFKPKEEKKAQKSKKSKKNEAVEGLDEDDIAEAGTVQVPWSLFEKGTAQRCSTDAETGCCMSQALLAGVHRMVAHMVSRMEGLAQTDAEAAAAAPELLGPALAALLSVRPEAAPKMDVSSQRRHLQLVETTMALIKATRDGRTPLRWRVKGLSMIKGQTPRFEVDYKVRKDADATKEKAQLKQLTRQKKREHKAAVREVRRDAEFLDQERYARETAVKQRLQAERHRNVADLEAQVGMANSLVKRGGVVAKGGGSADFKAKKRLKRGNSTK